MLKSKHLLSCISSPANTLKAGQGYWGRFSSATNLYDLGTTVPSTQAVSLSLAPGWNLIGNPRTTAVAGASLTFKVSTKSYTFAAATSANLVNGTLETWQAGDSQYENIPGAISNLQSYYGYWIYAYKACTLSYP